MVPIGGGSTKFVLSDRWIVYTKSRKQLLHRKYLLYETGCMCRKLPGVAGLVQQELDKSLDQLRKDVTAQVNMKKKMFCIFFCSSTFSLVKGDANDYLDER